MGTAEIVQVLLKHFAEVNAQDEEGITPLHLACMGANTEVVKALMTRQELLIELKDSQGNTPIHLAAQSLADEILIMLIERQPSVVTATNNAGKNCIDIFTHKGEQAGKQKRVQAAMEKIEALIEAQQPQSDPRDEEVGIE